MKKRVLEIMKCPYCGNNLEIKAIHKEESGEIITGYLKCECGEYPILEGILILKNSPMKKYIMEYFKKGEIEKATVLPFGDYTNDICRLIDFIGQGPFEKFLKKSSFYFVSRFFKKRYRKYSDKSTPFCKILGNSSYEKYLQYRFSAETLWSVYPFIPLLKKSKKRILDIGCGMGHASFIISAYVEPEELVCVDHNFKSLYLAKKYFVRDAQFICLNANYPLPFKNDIFDSVFMLDTFHYIQTRAQLANELKRVHSPQGLLLLLHLHNFLTSNMGVDYPLTPQAWINLFKGNNLKIKAIPERRIMEDFLLNNELDLTEEYSGKELNASNAISIIGTQDKSLFGVYDKVDSDFLSNKNNLVINLIYKINSRKDKVILKRDFPSDLLRTEYPFTERYLPEEIVINAELAQVLSGRNVNMSSTKISEKIGDVEDLMRQFVIINVPEMYL